MKLHPVLLLVVAGAAYWWWTSRAAPGVGQAKPNQPASPAGTLAPIAAPPFAPQGAAPWEK